MRQRLMWHSTLVFQAIHASWDSKVKTTGSTTPLITRPSTNRRQNWLQSGEPLQVYLSFPSLKDPEAPKHTAEVIAFADYDSFAPWREQSWHHRDPQYQQLKQRIQTGLLQMLDRHYPGFADLVDYCEVSTPLTNEHFTAHPKGGIYGLPAVAERFAPQNQGWTQVKTPIPGLYMVGSDVYVSGIAGALMGALFTTSQLPDGIPIYQGFMAATKAKSQTKRNQVLVASAESRTG